MSSNPKRSTNSMGEISYTFSLNMIVSELRDLFKYERKLREDLEEWTLENPTYQEILDMQRQQLLECDKLIKDRLRHLLLFPPCHSKHKTKLKAFYSVASYQESVFIMTKFPEGDSEADIGLMGVINVVSESIKSCGFYPRIASECDYHPQLWDNVELYLLGCSKGVAIIEDRYKPELNPNVAMEWGWMRGMGKDVLFLVEKDFKYYRADWSGLLEYRFSWDEPEDGIKQAIEKWLKGERDSMKPIDLFTSP